MVFQSIYHVPMLLLLEVIAKVLIFMMTVQYILSNGRLVQPLSVDLSAYD